tara:strand:+ start:274 stop:531 length:258 start_codon:yes stop_codon:yes gene_type:complete
MELITQTKKGHSMKVQTLDTIKNDVTVSAPVSDSIEEVVLGREIVEGEIHLNLTVQIDGEEVTQIVALHPAVVEAIQQTVEIHFL